MNPWSSGTTILASGARTTTQTSPDLVVNYAAELHVILDVTVIGTGNITVTINGKDPASGKYYALLTGAAVAGNGTNVYKVGRGLTAAANAVANGGIPSVVQVVITANNVNPVTYSVGMNLLSA